MNDRSEKISPSKENYLKVMLGLSNEEGIRSTDIANALGVSKASVSSMMNILSKEGYVTKERYGVVNLTLSGRNVAANIKRRYEVLVRFLHNILGVEAEVAAEDACHMEHIISSQTADRIDRRLNELSGYPHETKIL